MLQASFPPEGRIDVRALDSFRWKEGGAREKSLTPEEKRQIDRLAWALHRVRMSVDAGDPYPLDPYADEQWLQGRLKRFVEPIRSRAAPYIEALIARHALVQGDDSADDQYLPYPNEPASENLACLLDSDAYERYLEEKERCDDVWALAARIVPPGSKAGPAVRLHLYRSLHADSGRAYEEAIRTCQHLIRLEAQYAQAKAILPTIGVEVEVPSEVFTVQHREVLDLLEIPNYHQDEDLNEMNPDFSYSPWVQARLLQDLALWGAVPLASVTQPEGRPRVSKERPLSLHVNFGYPKDLNPHALGSWEGIYAINDVLTWAFTSPKRLMSRKTSQSVQLKEDAQPSEYGSRFRLELRAGEFRDFPTYRLLAESQCLMSIFYASQERARVNGRLSEAQEVLADLWLPLQEEVIQLSEGFSLTENIADSNALFLTEKMADGSLRAAARRIVASYARKAHAIVFPEG